MARKPATRGARARPKPKPRPFRNRLARTVHANAATYAGAIVALSLVLSALTFQPTPHTGGDNAAYITLGRSLLERHAYLELYDPAEPPHTQYPPVFPAILALAMAVGLQPWIQLKIIIALFGAAAAGMSFLWIRRKGRPVLALGVATLIAFAPGVLGEQHWILSDVPFWCFTITALWAFERLPPNLRSRFSIAIAATVLAFFTRSAGLPLALAAIAWLALRRRWRQLAIFAAVLVPLAFAWWLRARTHGGVDYVSQFLFLDPYSPSLGRVGIADLYTRATTNASNYVQYHLPILLTGRSTTSLISLSLIVLALAVVGWTRRVRRPTVAELFLPLYLGLLLVWPAVWSGERFLLPVLPLILFYAGDAVVWIANRVKPRAGFSAAAGAFVVLLLLAVPGIALEVRVGSECTLRYRLGERYPCLPSAEWRDFFSIAEFAGDALPENAAVISRKPTLFYILSGHPSRIYPFSDQPGAFFAAADSAGARYLVFDFLDRPTQAYVRPIVLRRPNAFCVLYSSPDVGTTVFGIMPGAASMPDAGSEDEVPSIAPCGDEYWRSRAVRESLEGGRVR
jgi:hypothetical protein